ATGTGFDVILGGLGADTIDGGAGLNVVFGDSGALTVTAGLPVSLATTAPVSGGDDSITTGDDADYIFGGAGTDTIIAGHGINLVLGDTGSATYSGALTVNLEATADAGAADDITTGSGD